MKEISSSQSKPKFLIDENVRIELLRFLKKEGYDVKSPTKRAVDTKVAFISKREKRILVTNDSDFTDPELYSQDELFAVVWLRIPQSESSKLNVSFKRLLLEYKENYKGKLFLLKEDSWEEYSLGITVSVLKNISPKP